MLKEFTFNKEQINNHQPGARESPSLPPWARLTSWTCFQTVRWYLVRAGWGRTSMCWLGGSTGKKPCVKSKGPHRYPPCSVSRRVSCRHCQENTSHSLCFQSEHSRVTIQTWAVGRRSPAGPAPACAWGRAESLWRAAGLLQEEGSQAHPMKIQRKWLLFKQNRNHQNHSWENWNIWIVQLPY